MGGSGLRGSENRSSATLRSQVYERLRTVFPTGVCGNCTYSWEWIWPAGLCCPVGVAITEVRFCKRCIIDSPLPTTQQHAESVANQISESLKAAVRSVAAEQGFIAPEWKTTKS